MTKRLGIAACLLVLFAGPGPAGARAQGAPDQAWALRSGPVAYTLVRKNEQLVLDYFGPASKAVAWSSAAQSQPHYDLAGLAAGQSLAPDSLRLSSQQTRTVAPGVRELRLALGHASLPLDVESRYTAWGETGVFTRDLTLTNRGAAPIAVASSPSIAWSLPKGEYTLRYLYGGWGQERQLAVEKLGAGARRFEQAKGRSTAGYVPWLSLRNESLGVEYLVDLAWSGNWWMQVERPPGGEEGRIADQELKVEIGIRHDFGGALTLNPGDSFELPRVAFTASDGDLDDAANQMHRYQREYVFPRSAANSPPLVHFNSWYPFQNKVRIGDAKRLVDGAAAIGMEAFVLDAGWYSEKEWSKEIGDWEVDPATFPNGLEELADYVRSKGMKFGLWVEIENVGPASRLIQKHPEWCLSYNGKPIRSGDRYQLDFAKPEVRQWTRGVVDRLVRKYRLGWIKLDYNVDIGDRFDPGPGGAGRRLYDHVRSYYAWLDEVRAAYPDLVVENCSSGALRFDTGIMAHAHTTWVSDVIDPRGSPQLRYGCTLQFSPEVCNHWMVGDKNEGIVNQEADPGWWDYMFRIAMNGQFGVSSRVFDWGPALRERAAANVALYKRIRGTIAGADVYHLTPAPDRVLPTGWMTLQYVAPGGERSVVMAHRLAGGAPEETFRLRGLAPDVVYEVSEEGKPPVRVKGADLAASGLRVALGEEWRAAVVEISAVKTSP